MIELLATVCLMGDPSKCKEVRIGAWSPEEMSGLQCQLWSLPARAQWMEAHPGWVITKWSCSCEALKAT